MSINSLSGSTAARSDNASRLAVAAEEASESSAPTRTKHKAETERLRENFMPVSKPQSLPKFRRQAKVLRLTSLSS